MSKKKRIIVLFASLSLLGGIFDQLIFAGQETTYIDLVLIPVFLFLSYSWYFYDSNEINFQRNLFMNVGIVGLSLLFYPYYFFKTRGASKGLLASIIFLVILSIGWCLDLGGMYFIYYTFQI